MAWNVLLNETSRVNACSSSTSTSEIAWVTFDVVSRRPLELVKVTSDLSQVVEYEANVACTFERYAEDQSSQNLGGSSLHVAGAPASGGWTSPCWYDPMPAEFG